MHIVYLLENKDNGTRKIGVTSDVDRRLSKLPGYSVVWVRDTSDCHVAARAESSVLLFLKHVAVFPRVDDGTSGFTEIFLDNEGPSTVAIIGLLESVIDDLELEI